MALRVLHAVDMTEGLDTCSRIQYRRAVYASEGDSFAGIAPTAALLLLGLSLLISPASALAALLLLAWLPVLLVLTTEKRDLLRDDIESLPSGAVVRLVFTGLNPALDVDLPAFAEELRTLLGLLIPHRHIVPLGPVLLLAALVGPALTRCNAKIANRSPGLRAPHLWVSPQVSD